MPAGSSRRREARGARVPPPVSGEPEEHKPLY